MKKIITLLMSLSFIFSNYNQFNQAFIDVSKNQSPTIVSIVSEKTDKMNNMFFFNDKKHFRIDKKLNDLSKIYNNCNHEINKCSNNQDFIIKKRYGKMILIRIKN